jgi:signal transduction histidine kinase
MANLIDNAVRHNAPAGFIEITTESDGPVARLTVESGGRAIDSDQAAALSEPFRRLGSERTGAGNGVGLGLAIVAAIATAHHGTLTLTARPDGGLRAVVELPTSQPPPGNQGRG